MKVKQNNGNLTKFDKSRIISSLIKETNLTEEESIVISNCVEQYLKLFKLSKIESGFIRTLVYQILVEKGYSGKKIGQYAPLYVPLREMNDIDSLTSEASRDNANVGSSPESVHKKKADFISKQQNLRMFPEYIELAHRSGDIHIHDLEYFRNRNFCLPGNNKVVIKRDKFTEVLSLEELYKSFNNTIQKDGFELSTSNEDIYIQGVNKFVKIVKMSKRHINENIIKIKTRSGRQISLTKEHKLLDNNILKQANEIVQGTEKTGSVLSKSNYIFEEYKYNFIDLSLYLDNTWKIYDNEICVRETNGSIPRYLKLDKRLGFFFGLFLGDGDLSNGKTVVFTKKDPEMRKIYISLVEELFGLQVRDELRDTTPQIIIDSVTLYTLLRNILKMDLEAKNKNIPDLLFNKNKEFNLGLIDGLFCTDGFFRKPNVGGVHSIYITTSEKLLLQLLHMLESMSINCTIERKQLQKNRNNSIFQICILGKNENKPSNKLRFDTTHAPKKQIFNSNDLNESVQSPNGLIVNLKEEEYYEGFVYDLTVESEDHLFCNADGIIISNCADYDLRHVFYHGVSIDGSGETSSICGPAIHPTVAILHTIKILGAGQVNSAGGQGFYNFLTFIAPYFKNLSYKEIKQQLQMFIYECNTMLCARGGQSVFSSVQLTPGVPELWKNRPVVWKGKVDNTLTYGDLDPVVNEMFKIFLEIMIEGDYLGRPFSFPKPEVCIRKEFLIDKYKDSYKKAFELSLKYGSTYYDNECTPKRNIAKGISCFQCQKGDTSTLIKNEFGEIRYITMEGLFNEYAVEQQDGWNAISNHIEINTRDSWIPIKRLYRVKNNKSIKIKTSRGFELETTFDHPYLTQNYITLAKDLKLTDKLKMVDNIKLTELVIINPQSAINMGMKINLLVDEIPRDIFNAQKESILYFLNGVNDCCGDSKFIRASEKSIRQLQYLYKMIGVDVEFIKKSNQMYKIININDVRKDMDGWCEILNIHKINYTNPVNFYDVEVNDDSHEFMAGNLLVTHNCCAFNFSIDPLKDPNFEDTMNFANEVGFSMGASQVVSINIPRLAMDSESYDELKENTENLIRRVVMPVFRIKDMVRKQMNTPFFSWPSKEKGIFNTDELSYVIGIIGMNEVSEIMESSHIAESKHMVEYIQWLNSLIDTISMEEQLEGRSKLALSRTPAETTAMRLAKLDYIKFGNSIKPYLKGDFVTGSIYYTNGCMIPPENEKDLIQKLNKEGIFFKYISGGNIIHIFLGENHPDIDGFAELMYNIFTKTDIDYFDVSRDLTICKDCKQIQYTISENCNKCNGINLLRIARITGYMQSINMWNDGKLDELKKRRRY